jgi:hypothetical protein
MYRHSTGQLYGAEQTFIGNYLPYEGGNGPWEETASPYVSAGSGWGLITVTAILLFDGYPRGGQPDFSLGGPSFYASTGNQNYSIYSQAQFYR